MSSPHTSNGAGPAASKQSPDPTLERQVAKLHRLEVWWRWLLIGLMWLTLGWWSLWDLRESIVLLSEYFSLTGLIYGFYFHLGAGFGLILCLLLTCSSVLWQLSYIFWGLSDKECHQLAVKVNKIQAAGAKHPLWRWIQLK